MKNIVLFCLFSFSTFAYCQKADIKNHNFNNGDLICSTNGKILGGDWFVGDSSQIGNFIGVYNEDNRMSNKIFSDIFKSSGVTYVNVYNGRKIKKGDYVTLFFDGKVTAMTREGISIGVALEDSDNEKVKIFIEYGYKKP